MYFFFILLDFDYFIENDAFFGKRHEQLKTNFFYSDMSKNDESATFSPVTDSEPESSMDMENVNAMLYGEQN